MNDTLIEIDGDDNARAAIVPILNLYGEGLCRLAKDNGTRIIVLKDGERYDSRSPMLHRLGAAVDEWEQRPAGIFVVDERTLYLSSLSPMTIAHELGHAFDCALGDGYYRSASDGEIRRAFAYATAFVTPYAASAVDEYMAEGFRSWIGVNDSHSLWPRATRARLWSLDPRFAAIMNSIFQAYDTTRSAMSPIADSSISAS